MVVQTRTDLNHGLAYPDVEEARPMGAKKCRLFPKFLIFAYYGFEVE